MSGILSWQDSNVPIKFISKLRWKQNPFGDPARVTGSLQGVDQENVINELNPSKAKKKHNDLLKRWLYSSAIQSRDSQIGPNIPDMALGLREGYFAYYSIRRQPNNVKYTDHSKNYQILLCKYHAPLQLKKYFWMIMICHFLLINVFLFISKNASKWMSYVIIYIMTHILSSAEKTLQNEYHMSLLT